ncbi:MAG: hypothetical protein KF691_13650 [Phycisphaeraceae bacterium]|nr:hypothetical protein [Phycisphaeraceae bacterium]
MKESGGFLDMPSVGEKLEFARVGNSSEFPQYFDVALRLDTKRRSAFPTDPQTLSIVPALESVHSNLREELPASEMDAAPFSIGTQIGLAKRRCCR